MKEKISGLVEAIFPQVVTWRRIIHAHPELAYKEFRTAALVAETLAAVGIEVQTQVADTGVVGLLRGKKNPDSRCIALRADMDALPITEENDVPYRSQVGGCMHACGHDFHTANLLGVAHVLAQLREDINGTIKFIFQPSEEKMPSGAAAMIAAGVLQNPAVQAIYGLHVHPELPAGEVGFCAGKCMASADEIYVTAHGKGGHAAQPQNFISPLLIAAEIITKLQAETNLQIPVVLSFGKVVANGATNVIPESCEVAGTLRCFEEKVRSTMHEKIVQVCREIAAKHGGTCDVNIVKGYPVLQNDELLTSQASAQAKRLLGDAHVHNLVARMGAEDFSFYSQQVPACFYRVGVGNAVRGITAPIHSPRFDVEEEALKTAMKLMCVLALNTLSEQCNV